MAIIKGIHLLALRNTEYCQFVTDVLELLRRNDPSALNVQEVYDRLKSENDQLVNLLNRGQSSALTQQVVQADNRRDSALTGIQLMVAAYTRHWDATLRAHAIVLERHLKLYGGTTLGRWNYQSETAGITSLVADWDRKADLTEALAALNLMGWKDELEAANKTFNKVYMQRTEEASQSNPLTVRALRVSMNQLYYELRNRLSSFHTIHHGAVPYGKVVNHLNVIIRQYNVLLTSRKASKKKQTTSSEEDAD